MSRVKFNAKQEYEYLANFKILQNHFKAKKIDKVRIYLNTLAFCDMAAHDISRVSLLPLLITCHPTANPC